MYVAPLEVVAHSYSTDVMRNRQARRELGGHVLHVSGLADSILPCSVVREGWWKVTQGALRRAMYGKNNDSLQ